MLFRSGIYEEVSAAAIKRVLSRQIEAAMKERQFWGNRSAWGEIGQPELRDFLAIFLSLRSRSSAADNDHRTSIRVVETAEGAGQLAHG